MIYRFNGFTLSWDPVSGECYTIYRDGTKSGCGVVDDDHHHASLLGISPEEHRLQHELAHHIVGVMLYGFRGSPVVWRDAQGIDQAEGGHYKAGWTEAEREEWVCNLIQYKSRNKAYDTGAEQHAIAHGMDVDQACRLLSDLLNCARYGADRDIEVLL